MRVFDETMVDPEDEEVKTFDKYQKNYSVMAVSSIYLSKCVFMSV